MGYEKIEIKLPESAIRFLDYCNNVRGLTKGTIDGYEVSLRLLFNFLHKTNKRVRINDNLVKQIDLNTLNSFIVYLQKDCETKNKVTSVATKVASIKAYFNYLQNVERLITSNPSYDLRSPKTPKRKPITLNIDESKNLLNSLDKWSCTYFRDKCILTIFLNCGLRISELCNIKLKDIKDNKIKIIGKGNKERDAFLNTDCINALNEYLSKERKEDGILEEDKQYLFLSNKKTHIKDGAVRNMVEKYVAKAGLTNEKITPHKLRGSFATNVYRKTKNIRTVQVLLGHSTVVTSQRYIGYDEEELQNSVNNIYE